MHTHDTKDIILSATFKLLLLKGYDAVSISDIQAETGMSRGLLYHYFGNKEKLFVEATMKYFTGIFNVDLERIKVYDIEQMIGYMIDKNNDIYAKTLGEEGRENQISIMSYDFLFYRVIQESEEFKMKYRQIREQEIVAWELVLMNASIAGKLRTGLDNKRVAAHFVYLMDGVWMSAVNNNSSDILIVGMRETLLEYYNLIKQ